MAHLFQPPSVRAWSSIATAVSGAKVYFYDAQTSTPRTTFTTPDLDVEHAVPVVALSNSVFPPIYLDPVGGPYKVDMKDPITGVSLPGYPIDNLEALPSILELRNATEISLGITPVNLQYFTQPYVDGRRYLSSLTGGSTQTTGLQAGITMMGELNSELRWPAMDVKSGALSYTFNGDRTTQSFALVGAGMNGTKITAIDGLASPLLKLTSLDPVGASVQEANIRLEHFSLLAPAVKVTGGHGLSLEGVGNGVCSGVTARGFDKNLNMRSSLVWTFDQDTRFEDGNWGAYIRTDGSLNTSNLIRFIGCKINLNAMWAVDYNHGSGLHLISNDIEGNGTAADLNTGGLLIGGELSPITKFSNILLDNNWLEINKGYTVYVAAPTNGCETTIVIKGGEILGAEGGRSIKIFGATRAYLENAYSPTPGDTWDITCTDLFAANCNVGVLTDSGVTYPHYDNVRTSTANYINGKDDSYTGTLTGVSGTVTGDVFINQQGDRITVEIRSNLVGTSTSTAATITGMPARYRPSVNRVVWLATLDNTTTTTYSQCTVGSNGTITLAKLDNTAGFTAANNKGWVVSGGTYKK